MQWAEPSKAFQRLSLRMKTQSAAEGEGPSEEEGGEQEYSIQACVGIYRQILVVRAAMGRAEIKRAMQQAIKRMYL